MNEAEYTVKGVYIVNLQAKDSLRIAPSPCKDMVQQ